MVWIGSKNPNPFNRQFIYLARGVNVKMPWRLVFVREIALIGRRSQEDIYGAGYYLQTLGT